MFALAEVLRKSAAAVLRDPVCIAYASSSVLSAYSNARSDVDLFVVPGSAADVPAKRQIFLSSPPRRVDVSVYERDDLLALAERINAIRASDAASVERLVLDELSTYYRTATGIPVRDPDGFAALRNGFDEGHATRLFAAKMRGNAAGALRGAHDALERGRRRAAYLRARTALESTINALAAESGEGYPNEKLAFAKLARLRGRESAAFRLAWSLNGLGRRSIGSYVGLVTAYCADNAIQGAEAVSRRPVRFVPRVDPRCGFVAIGGRRHVIAPDDRIYPLTEAEQELLARCGADRDADDVARELVSRGAYPHRDAVLHAFESLAARNVMTGAQPAANEAHADDRGEPSASTVFVRDRLTSLRWLVSYRFAVEDVAGALDAGQNELALAAARRTLSRAIRCYVARTGPRAAPDACHIDALAAAVGADSPLLRAAWSLECRRPFAPPAARAYARACVRFAERELTIDPQAGWWRSPWTERTERKFWSLWLPLLTLAQRTGVTTDGFDLVSTLRVATELAGENASHDPPNGSRNSIVSSRPGPVETMTTGAPTSCSRRRT
jgi:hypothetical protein